MTKMPCTQKFLTSGSLQNPFKWLGMLGFPC